jgi:DNA-binding CsgD family transcriptional regulator
LVLHITPRERAALRLLANGLSTNDLARRFGVSEYEMDAHLNTLFARMGAAGRTEAIVAAARRGLLIPNQRPDGRRGSIDSGRTAGGALNRAPARFGETEIEGQIRSEC